MLLDREGRSFAPPSSYPHLSLACVTNHDLPTLAGWWKGADIEEELELGRKNDAAAALEERALEREELVREVGKGDLSEAVHRHLARGGSGIVTVQADDLAGEESAVNLPGTDTERPNWRRKLAKPVDELMRDAAPILEEVGRSRG
jgi:glycogen operon protein